MRAVISQNLPAKPKFCGGCRFSQASHICAACRAVCVSLAVTINRFISIFAIGKKQNRAQFFHANLDFHASPLTARRTIARQSLRSVASY